YHSRFGQIKWRGRSSPIWRTTCWFSCFSHANTSIADSGTAITITRAPPSLSAACSLTASSTGKPKGAMPDMKATRPLISGFDPLDTIGWTHGAAVSAAEFCAAAVDLAGTLPKKRFLLNLCNNRFNFALAFAAALIARQVSLLPQSRAVATLRDLHVNYPDSYCVADDGDLPAALPA